MSLDLRLFWLILDQFGSMLAFSAINEGFRTKSFEMQAKYFMA